MEATLRLPRRSLGRTGLQVSPLGLARVFGPWVWTEAPRARLDADEVAQAFHDFGVNTFLVSPRMQEPCEGVRRLIRAGHRDKLVLVSGQGLPWAAPARRGLEKHLRALGTDHLDVWLIGWLHAPALVRAHAWPELCRLREEGKARAIGFSCHDRTLATRLARELDPDVLMIRYNASHRGAEHEVLSRACCSGRSIPRAAPRPAASATPCTTTPASAGVGCSAGAPGERGRPEAGRGHELRGLSQRPEAAQRRLAAWAGW